MSCEGCESTAHEIGAMSVQVCLKCFQILSNKVSAPYKLILLTDEEFQSSIFIQFLAPGTIFNILSHFPSPLLGEVMISAIEIFANPQIENEVSANLVLPQSPPAWPKLCLHLQRKGIMDYNMVVIEGIST